jgi:WD40 repeat protein
MSRFIRPLCALLLGLALACVAQPAAPPGLLDRHGDPLPRGAAARLGSVRYRIVSGDGTLTLSPDGKRAYVASSIYGSVSVIDAATGRRRRLPAPKFKDDAIPQTSVLTPACDRVLAHTGSELVLYDAETGKQRWSIKAAAAVSPPSFDPAGTHFARFEPEANQMQGTVFVCRTDNGKQAAAVAVKGQAAQFALAPGGTRLATWSQQANVAAPRPGWELSLWDTSKNKELAKVQFRTGVPFAEFRPDGKELAVSAGSTVSLVDPSTGKVTRTLRASTQPNLLCYSPDGKYLAVVGPRRADLWETKTWKRLPTRPLPESCHTTSVAFPAAGRLTVAGLRGREVILTDARTGRSVRPASGHEGPVTSVHFDGARVLTAGSDGKLTTWDLAGRQLAQVTAVALPDYVAGAPPAFAVGPRAAIDPLSELVIGRVTFSPSGRWVISGELICVYDRTEGEMRFEELAELAAGGEACVARDVDVLFVSGLDEDNPNGMGVKMTALRLGDGEVLWTVKVPSQGGGQGRIAASPDGKVVALAFLGGDGQTTVRLFDGSTGKPLANARDFEKGGQVGALLEFSGDGRTLVASVDGVGLFVLDGRTGELLQSVELTGHVASAALDASGRMAAVAVAKDEADVAQVVRVVELSSGKTRMTFAPGDQVTALSFSPDGRCLASGHDGGTAMLWHLEPEPTSSKVELWRRLRGEDADDAWRAAWQLRRDPANAVAVVSKNVKPAPPGPAAADVKKLIAALDDEDVDGRDDSEQALRKHGRSVEAAMRAALKVSPSAEASRRLKRLLAALPAFYTDTPGLRAVELLEGVGTPAARKVLAELAKGDESAARTREAKAALARLTKADKAKEKRE